MATGSLSLSPSLSLWGASVYSVKRRLLLPCPFSRIVVVVLVDSAAGRFLLALTTRAPAGRAASSFPNPVVVVVVIVVIVVVVIVVVIVVVAVVVIVVVAVVIVVVVPIPCAGYPPGHRAGST